MAHQTTAHRTPAAGAPDLERARRATLRAARWLVVLDLAIHESIPSFGPYRITYHHRLDPAATDVQRRDACAGRCPTSTGRRSRSAGTP